MKAFILNTPGLPEHLILKEIEKPSITKDEVLVEVKALGINPADVKARSTEEVLTAIYGTQRPVILGWDIAGQVVEIGEDVVDFKVGDHVFGMVNFFGNGKAYAEYVAAPAAHLAHKPNTVSYQEAATASLAAMTAYQALVDVAKVKKGDKVLIHAASGGVGHFAVQIAKHFGAHVVGTSSSKNKDFVLGLGADEHIDYTNEEPQADYFDIIFDTVSEKTLLKSLDAVKPQGRIITITSFDFPEAIKKKVDDKEIDLQFMRVESKKETIQAIANLLEHGFLKSHIYQNLPFSNMAEAHRLVESGRVVGKVSVTH